MDQGRRTSDRKSVGLLVKLKHETVGSFTEEFATNISPGGMFIRSRTPQPVGTPVRFEVQIANGVRVLQGTATVRWVRDVNDPAGPPGMGLQFQELDTASRALVDLMLQRKPGSSAAPAAPLPSIAPMVAPGIAPLAAPGIAPLTTPGIAPVRPPVAAPPAAAAPRPAAAPARPAAVAPPAQPAAGGAALDSLFDDLDAPSSPAPGADEPLSLGGADEPFSLGSPDEDLGLAQADSANDVDIPLDELIAGTPPPTVQGVLSGGDEPLPGLDFEFEAPVVGEPIAMGEPLEEVPIEVGLSVEDGAAPGDAGGFELDFSDVSPEPPPRAAPVPPAPVQRAAPPPPPAAPPVAPAKPSGGSAEFDFDLSSLDDDAPLELAREPTSSPGRQRPLGREPASSPGRAAAPGLGREPGSAAGRAPGLGREPGSAAGRAPGLGREPGSAAGRAAPGLGLEPGSAAGRAPGLGREPGSAAGRAAPGLGLEPRSSGGRPAAPGLGLEPRSSGGRPAAPGLGLEPLSSGGRTAAPGLGREPGSAAGRPSVPGLGLEPGSAAGRAPGLGREPGSVAGRPGAHAPGELPLEPGSFANRPAAPGLSQEPASSWGRAVPQQPPAPQSPSGGSAEFDLDLSIDDDGPLELAREPASSAGRPAARPVAPPPQQPPPSVLPPSVRHAPPAPAAPVAPATLAPAAAPVAPAPPALDANGQVRPIYLTPPQTLAGTGPVIGIDLGTTNSCVALLSNGRPVVLRSREGYNTIPSVISLSAQNKLLVSHRAKNQLVLRPTHTIYGAKRLVGRPYDSAVVKQVRERFHYEITPDAAGRAAVRLGNDVLSLEEVQGIILRECKEMAETHLNQKVERAVVTVPAYYSEPQREAVRKAGAMAGLKVERILNEPTSAALAYGLNRELNKRVLVYDLGGGTFDATILRIEKNVFEVLGTGGDIFLGGIDFDNLIVDFLLERFQEKEGIAFNGDGIALSRVGDAAERAKMALSERSTFEVHIPMLMMDDAGRPRDLRVTMSRQDLEKICDPLLNRTIDVVRDVLLDSKLKASEVDDIILVGGMSRMPLVRDKLKGLFSKNAQASVNADEAVALGAALYSGSVDKVSSVVLIDVLPMTIGVAMPGGGFKRVVERNSPLPTQRSFAISTSQDNEERMELSIFQGEDNHISANEYLGTVRMEGLPKGPKGSVRVAVTLKLDSECVLHVEAREYSTRKEVKATLATRYSPEELQKQLQVSKEAVKAAEDRRGADLKDRAGRFWGFVKKALGRK
ncbi:TIGR02266 family protein [Corallococcus sp. AS-1-12]|uniref:TIGR02266 family protein n=1 Tax=Corallococcus sp. AS-1-12 TaxID=2874598 RepID=UPI001CC186FB|nr:TIGR02266 family protein [Corallococcus sp. AS-1-12]MBZ4335486.1 TIGR02266 family protein [Corallococcus sp. AS-1-12]